MKFLRFFVLMLATMVCGNVFAQKDLEQLMSSRGEYYFTLTIQQPTEIKTISDLCSVDGFDGHTVVCYANQKQYENLLNKGYELTLLTPPSMREEHAMWDGSNRAAYEWDSYPTYEAYEAMMQQFATDYPERCTYMELGTLASGRKLMVCRLNSGNPDGKVKFLYTSTMHGDEVTGMMLMLRLINEFCTSNDARILNLLDNVDIFISPCTNPDGTYHGGNSTVNGATRYNAAGVDLNRHYPDFDKGPHPDGASYYQDETVWLMDLAQEYLFTMSANYHGGAEVMNYPWDTYQPTHPDDAWWQLVCHEYADLAHQQSSSYMSDYNNGIINGYSWYTISGSRQDYMNYYAQCREVTIECSNTKTPPASQMPTFWNYNYNSMLAYIEQSLYGIHGTVTDASTGAPLAATVTIEGHDHHGSSVTSHLPAGDYHRPIKGGTYNVTYSCNGYYPQTISVTVTDGQTVIQDVQLEAGEGLIPNFSANTTNVAIGGSVNFTDETWGANLVSWEWTFEGGTPATSTQQNPTGIVYNEVGSYNVTLSVTNADGQTETVTKNRFINVSEPYNMQNATINTCNAIFYDDGGHGSNYGNNLNITMTFMPDTEGGMIEVIFQEFETESGYDKLYIYDGTSVSAAPLGEFSGNDSPGTVTATNADGAITFRFTSDGSVTRSGWAAVVRCAGLPMEVTAEVENDTICKGETNTLSVYASGGSGEYTYLWSPAENLDDATAQNPVFTATESGDYTFTVTVSDGTESESATVSFYVTECLGVEEIDVENVSVYPNPASSMINIDGLNGFANLEVSIVNLQGQIVMKVVNSLEINLKDVDAGIYFININCDGKQIVRKIVVE